MTDYIHDTSFASTLSSAMDQWQEALVKRWREEIAKAMEASEYYPTSFIRAMPPFGAGMLWDHTHRAAIQHIRGPGAGCPHIEWALGAQDGSPSSISCDGSTGVREEEGVEVPDGNGNMVTVPPNIECGVLGILESVEDWAHGERLTIYNKLPLFDSHDQTALKDAHDDLLRIGAKLGLDPSGADVDVSFSAVSERDIAQKADALAGVNSAGKDWWEGWTGLTANQAASGMFASVIPTVNNQSQLAGCLANLYSMRASIIEAGRNNTLHCIQKSTEAFESEIEVTTDHTPGWKVLQGAGLAMQMAPPAAAVGAGVALVGFIGENLFGETTEVVYEHEIGAVVSGLDGSVDDIDSDLRSLELDYAGKVSQLRSSLHSVHSYNLELYDLTANAAEGGGRDGDGYTADVDAIMSIGQTCFQCGELYEELLPLITGLGGADSHLSDRDGSPTSADTDLIATRDEFEGFLSTACGRFYTAGEQTVAAAEAYAETDMGEAGQFERFMESWNETDDTSRDYSVNPGNLAEETDRTTDPYADHPALGGGEPGSEETEYVVERN